ncbi:MAG: dockerin type I repeat-containing protein [Myxococcales bacterium]
MRNLRLAWLCALAACAAGAASTDAGGTAPSSAGSSGGAGGGSTGAASGSGTTSAGGGSSGGSASTGGPGGGPSPGNNAILGDGGYYNLGMNLPSIIYWNNTAIYADVTLQMCGNRGPWDTSNPDAPAPLDATGAPTVAASSGWPSDYPSGSYTLTWDGTGSLTFHSGGVLGPVTSVVDGGLQHNTATVTVTQKLTQTSDATAEYWNQVTATPPVTNIHWMAPPSLQSADGRFMQPFLDRLQPFTTLRFMWTLNTIDSTVVNWSQRTWPSSGSRGATLQGMAYEDVVALANDTGKNVWINLPAWATDDYVCRLARLLRYGEPGDRTDSTCDPAAPPSAPAGAVPLDPALQVYVEYSNEIWNWDYQETADLDCMANGVPPSGHVCTILPDGGNTAALGDGGVLVVPTSAVARAALADPSIPWTPYAANLWNRGTEMGFVLTKRDGDIFKQVFGSQAGRIHNVYNLQSAYPAEANAGLSFMVSAYGSVSGSIDALAVAPYFNIPADTADAGEGCFDCTVDDIFQEIGGAVLGSDAGPEGSQIASWLQQDLAQARKYGVQLVAYEGGEGLAGKSSNLITAQFDPRMYAATQAALQLWDRIVGRGQLFTYFTYDGSCGTFGCWGALLNGEDVGQQKWDALMPLVRPVGDANLDGTVDSVDCAIVQGNLGKSGMWWMEGDFNHDGQVDAEDLSLLNENIGGPPCQPP